MSEIDDESRFFWDGLRQRRLLLQRCDACRRHRFPPMPSCPWCGAVTTSVIESEGAGAVYSWVTVHHAFDERWVGDVPYTVAVVELRERCRVVARVESPPPRDLAGLDVVPRYVDHDDWTELRFAPAARGA